MHNSFSVGHLGPASKTVSGIAGMFIGGFGGGTIGDTAVDVLEGVDLLEDRPLTHRTVQYLAAYQSSQML